MERLESNKDIVRSTGVSICNAVGISEGISGEEGRAFKEVKISRM